MVENKLRDRVLAALNRKAFNIPFVSITGGKGGVGKSTISVNIATALAEMGYRVMLMDADVDAPDDHILLGISPENPFIVTVTKPVIMEEKCTLCGKCVRACRRNVLFQPRDHAPLVIGDCNGCEACILSCPEEAIRRDRKAIGNTYMNTRGRLRVLTGTLLPAVEQSAVVVNALRERLFASLDDSDVVIVDTSPGVHCNVINAVRGSDSVYVVTEPTPLGIHDIERSLRLLSELDLRARIILNFSNLPGPRDKLNAIARRYDAMIVCEHPMDEIVLESHIEGVPVVEMYPHADVSARIRHIAEEIAAELLG
jgi:MinD superfamily P-loop ATPase